MFSPSNRRKLFQWQVNSSHTINEIRVYRWQHLKLHNLEGFSNRWTLRAASKSVITYMVWGFVFATLFWRKIWKSTKIELLLIKWQIARNSGMRAIWIAWLRCPSSQRSLLRWTWTDAFIRHGSVEERNSGFGPFCHATIWQNRYLYRLRCRFVWRCQHKSLIPPFNTLLI